MPSSLRNSRTLTFRPTGLSDAIDGSNAPPGAMRSLANLVPAPHTRDLWMPRPAGSILTGVFGFGEAMLVIGPRVYMIRAGIPIIYDLTAAAFVAVSGITGGNTPTPQPTTGDWVPATMDQVGAYVFVTHPGFTLPNAFGWFDMTGFTSNALTGNTHTTTVLDTLSANALTAGWRPGQTISSSAGDIPAGTRILSINAVGTSVTLSAAATGSNAGVTLTVAGGTFAAPLWCAGNLNENGLVAVATAVAQYAGSACFAVNTASPVSAAVVFSDAGDPLRLTNAGSNQVITFLNGLPVTALKGLPLSNVTGGVLQSLLAFQSDTGIQQLTGTPILKNLGINVLNDSVGTLAPNSLTPTPLGLAFIAPDGLRFVTFAGTVSEPIGDAGGGVAAPFIYAQNQSRICAAYNEDVLRITVTTPLFTVGAPAATVQTVEYWYHLALKKWSGPHSLPAILIQATQTPHGFVMIPVSFPTILWSSDSLLSANSSYIEAGTQMTFSWVTCLQPDTGSMAMNAMLETAISIALPDNANIQATALDEAGTNIGVAVLQGTTTTPATWGLFTWGAAVWGAGAGPYRQQRVTWGAPVIFKQMEFALTGDCAAGLTIGNLYMRWQELGYELPAAG